MKLFIAATAALTAFAGAGTTIGHPVGAATADSSLCLNTVVNVNACIIAPIYCLSATTTIPVPPVSGPFTVNGCAAPPPAPLTAAS